MIDVGQGDSILLRYPNNKNNILIDTGGIMSYPKEKWQERTSNYSIASDTIIPYLKSLGISSLDYLILTHGDNDHCGEAINLIKNFKVNNVIFNKGTYNKLEEDIITVLKQKHIKYFNDINKIDRIYFINNNIYNDENNNSIVNYIEYNRYKFLFMGDASTKVEESILNKYNIFDIDILKVGHHGSETSSGEEFIDIIKPRYSLISVGKKNRYNHPNKKVINNLADSKVFRTDIDGSIHINIFKTYYTISTCVE